ncbi:MAG: phage holin family protein [Deltaproteobacteria bacterium]|nr:phage holin family protein [Deltaproteobacteria bacterium]
MSILISWLLLSVSVWITSRILPGFQVRNFGSAIVVAAIFGLLNWLLGWLFFVAIGLGTLGIGFLLAFITRWIVNAIMLKITDLITDRLEIRSFSWALAAALIMSLLGTVGEYVVSHAQSHNQPRIHIQHNEVRL